jgi:hypothetical protein
MISDFLITIIYNTIAVIIKVFTLLPDVSLNSGIAENLANIAPYYMSLDVIFPVTVLLIIITVELAFEGSILTYKFIKWSYQKIPFIN